MSKIMSDAPSLRESPAIATEAASGDYSIGSAFLPGLSKLIEECGEVTQVCGKIIGARGMVLHWDGSDLKERLEDEMADLWAAMLFFRERNGLDNDRIHIRVVEKLRLFGRWHDQQTTPGNRKDGSSQQTIPGDA